MSNFRIVFRKRYTKTNGIVSDDYHYGNIDITANNENEAMNSFEETFLYCEVLDVIKISNEFKETKGFSIFCNTCGTKYDEKRIYCLKCGQILK